MALNKVAFQKILEASDYETLLSCLFVNKQMSGIIAELREDQEFWKSITLTKFSNISTMRSAEDRVSTAAAKPLTDLTYSGIYCGDGNTQVESQITDWKTLFEVMTMSKYIESVTKTVDFQYSGSEGVVDVSPFVLKMDEEFKADESDKHVERLRSSLKSDVHIEHRDKTAFEEIREYVDEELKDDDNLTLEEALCGGRKTLIDLEEWLKEHHIEGIKSYVIGKDGKYPVLPYLLIGTYHGYYVGFAASVVWT